MPRFSVIMPAHNAANRMQMPLDSIKSQHFKDYELIVVCDACTDVTEDIAKYYGTKTKCINAHSDGVARSTGLDMATGEWIIFVDDDDRFLHEYVFSQIDQKLKEIECDVLCFSFVAKNWGYKKPTDNKGVTGTDEHWTAVWTKVWRREFIGDTRFQALPRGSDVHFTFDIWAKKPRVYDWDCPMYYYNVYEKTGGVRR